jgi:TonB family protein
MAFFGRSARVTFAVAVLLLVTSIQASAQILLDMSLAREAFQRSGIPPKPIKQGQPVYPDGMARAGLIGAVKVEFTIDTEGNVRNPFVVESNNPWFERPAVDAILGWKFIPGERNGHPVNVRAVQLISFDLEPEGQRLNLWRVDKGKEHDKLPPEFQWDTPPIPVYSGFPVYPFEQLKSGMKGKARIT